MLASAAFALPSTPLEASAVEIWQQVLGLTGVGVQDDFFELGGTSIVAARVAFALQEQSGQSCTGVVVLQTRCIRDLCEAVERAPEARAIASPLEFVRRKASVGKVLSFGQEQMLILQNMNPTSGFYNQPLVLGLFGPVDAALLQRCINGLIARHDALRTRYVQSKDGSWAPLTLEDGAHLVMELVDLSHTEDELDTPSFEKLLAEEYSKPFDLFKQLPIRATLFKLRSCSALMLVIHHVASDGWSMNVIQNDLTALYQATVRYSLSCIYQQKLFGDFLSH